MLSLNLLRIFNSVVEQKGVVRASERLFISQPAVSTALKKLQNEIDVRLFHKAGRNLVLTEQGTMLYELTKRMFETEKEIEDLVAQLNFKEKQTIHLGLVTIYERFGVKDILLDFAEIDRNLSVSIHSGNSSTIVEMLGNKRWDMGIAGNVIQDKRLCYSFYRKHEVFMVAPQVHRLYGKRYFSAEDLRGERVVLKELGSSVRTTVDNFLIRDAVQIIPIMELSNIDSILNLAETENCITFLPDLSIKGLDKDRFSKARLRGSELSFSTYVVAHPSSEYTTSKRRLIWNFIERIQIRNKQESNPKTKDAKIC